MAKFIIWADPKQSIWQRSRSSWSRSTEPAFARSAISRLSGGPSISAITTPTIRRSEPSWAGSRSERSATRSKLPCAIFATPCLVICRRWACCLKLESRGDRVLVKHPDGIERELGQIHSAQFGDLVENVVRHGDDIAPALRGLEDIEHFAHASPEQLRLRQVAQHRQRIFHQRHRIHASIGDASGEHGNDTRHLALHRFRYAFHLLPGKDRGKVQPHTFRT